MIEKGSTDRSDSLIIHPYCILQQIKYIRPVSQNAIPSQHVFTGSMSYIFNEQRGAAFFIGLTCIKSVDVFMVTTSIFSEKNSLLALTAITNRKVKI